jgi:hypothetical protein
MKKNIFLLGMLVIILAFGIAVITCTTLTPEEIAAIEARRTELETDGKGGIIVVIYNERASGRYDVLSPYSVTGTGAVYYYSTLRPVYSGTGTGTVYQFTGPNSRQRFLVEEDGRYIIRYRSNPENTIASRNPADYNHQIAVNVSGDQTVTVRIPE